MNDINELRNFAETAHYGHLPLEVSGSEMLELLDRLEAAEKEREIDEQRIADLMAELNRVGHENDALRAKITEMEKQEPVGWFACTDGEHQFEVLATNGDISRVPLYALPGAQAQPAPSVPDAVMAALENLDDYIARIEGNDRGACHPINLIRRYLLDAAEVGGNK